MYKSMPHCFLKIHVKDCEQGMEHYAIKCGIIRKGFLDYSVLLKLYSSSFFI